MLKQHIQTIEVGASGASSVTISNIPQNYDDLLVVMSFRCALETSEHITIRFNNSTADFIGRYFGAGGTGGQGSGIYARYLGNQTRANAYAANTFGNAQAYISNYSKALPKNISSDTVSPNTTSTQGIVFASNLWNNTSPVTSITFTNENLANFAQFSSASLYGIKRGSDGVTLPAATGGTVTTSGGFTIHTFTGSGTFTANRNLRAEYLVIGGGGGGAHGGGGAGGYRCSVSGESSGGGAAAEQPLNLIAGTSYAVTVGAGGPNGFGISVGGANGAASSFAGITAIGGGRAGSVNAPASALSGGSGGGAGGSAGSASGGAGTAGQGFAGGNSASPGSNQPSAGGGGAGGAGSPNSGLASGAGGAGISSSITGGSVARAGGGGGGQVSTNAPGSATAGGGAGTWSSNIGNNGTANSGGGGGGAGFDIAGGSGGSGIVIIRYPTPA